MAELNGLRRQRAANKGKLTLILNTLKKSSELPVEECKAKLARVEKLMDEFTAIENQILQFDESLEIDADYETNYYSAVAQLNSIIRKMTWQNNTVNTSQDSPLNATQAGGDIRLPKLNIPTFSGVYTEWQSFYDLYVTSVHDSSTLSAVQKFQYLKGLLRGEAANLLRHLSITEANYIEALQKLRQRYDRKRHTMNAFIRGFIEQPSISVANNINIKRLLDTSDEILRGLKAMGTQCEQRDPWLLYILCNKLDNESKGLWAQETANKDFPTMQELFDFLLRRVDAIDSLQTPTRRNYPAPDKPAAIKSHMTVSGSECPVCQATDHWIHQCKVFNQMEVDQRRDWVKSQRRCFNCLSDKHAVFRCPSKRRCLTCKGKHHTLVHVKAADTPEPTVSSSNAVVSYPKEPSEPQYILPTALTDVVDSVGNTIRCRALLDSGSQVNFITESLFQRLRLPRQNGRILVKGVGKADAGTTKGTANITIQPTSDSTLTIKVFILNHITTLPRINITQTQVDKWGHLPLADPEFDKASDVDLLIGTDQFFNILTNGHIKGTEDQPAFQNTIFGWIVAGNIPKMGFNRSDPRLCFTSTGHEFNIDQTLRRFWEIESIGNDVPPLSAEERLCEDTFNKSVTRCPDGRLQVRLPFKTNTSRLGASLNMAIQRMRNMERRFSRDEGFHGLYKRFMHDYLQLGHMKEISPQFINDGGYFLPHHGVVKTDNNVTKIRVVFDGSAKTSSGVSLNDCLAVGPTVQSTLYAIILRFREHRIIFAADIEKMYRQIRLHDDDTKYQRIVWRDEPTQPIRYFTLRTVTYGLSSASYLATRSLKMVADDIRAADPVVADIIERSIYVDDLMTGGDSVEEVKRLKESLTSTLSSYGLPLRKWVSNSKDILEDIPVSDRQQQVKSINDQTSDQSISILGLQYDPAYDVFKFRVCLPTSAKFTKRMILSEAGRIFDPLGWIAPVNIKIKIFIQQLWLLNLGWDDPLPLKEIQEWESIRARLPTIEEISIPRFVHTSKQAKVELHGFCDASTLAFAAVAYYKVTTESGDTFTHLISAKTKVAPVKQQSIPRLELCGALLLTKLMSTLKRETTTNAEEIYLWTDSTIVLDWLSSHPRRWPTFIANRTSEIVSAFNRQHWRHVPSQQNPADCASRGAFPNELKDNIMWWKGPCWLSASQDRWPAQQADYATSNMEEIVLTTTVEHNVLEHLISRCSSFHKLQRIVAYCLRFIAGAKKQRSAVPANFVTRTELYDALFLICKHEQGLFFKQDIVDIKKSRLVQGSSKLKSLSPFIDEMGTLRVGGRLEKCNVPFSTKHPIIMSPKSAVTALILDEMHRKYNHPGPSLLLALSRQQFWIPGGRNLIRKTIRNCVPCTRQSAKSESQLMSNLPEYRVELIRPFLKVGVDYAGPVFIYLTKGRGQRKHKAYICLFICLSTKAVHIELASDLSTEAFLAALRRFVARRGCCQDIYSDNGSNFIGANNHLKKIRHCIQNSNEISHFISSKAINWHFIPPNAPHFGGIWESAIKSTKHHLRRVIGDTVLTLEEMNTLLTEIESILNSRPLCVLSAEEIDALTPSHFLLGQPSTTIPERDVTHIKASHLSRWQMIQAMKQHFWKRWQMEYITSLQPKPKWQKPKPPVNINDIVVIRDDNQPANKWLLGKVTAVHPGSDLQTRVITIQTRTGELKRPVTKIVKLPIIPIEHNCSTPAVCSRIHA